MRAPLPPDEPERLRSLYRLNILDTPPEQSFDDLTRLASAICGTPIALLTLIDRDRQWFKSRFGLTATQTHRDVSFCAHAILQTDLFEIHDARTDARFCDNPLVTGEPYLQFYAGAPLRDAGGHALGALCVIDVEPRELSPVQRDALLALARQTMTQFELQEANQRWELVTASSQDGQWDWLDMDASLWWWSRSCFELLGVSPDLPPSSELALSLIHPEDLQRLEIRFREEIEAGRLGDAEVRFRVGDSYRWFLLRALYSEPSQGCLRRLTGSLSDIHDLKQSSEALRRTTRQAQAASLAKSEFFARMSHELRTPLNSVIGFSQVLQEQTAERLNAKEARYLANIQRSGQHLLSIVNDVLEMCRIDSGDPGFESRPVHLGETLRSALARLDKQGVAASPAVELPSESDLWVLADPSALEQIFFQLFSNALKFTPREGRVWATIETSANEVTIAVRDSGIGIHPDQQQRVFREFEQLDQGYARTQDGTGLGLTLVKRLMESHGKFWLESSGVAGEGTAFFLQLPRSEAGGRTSSVDAPPFRRGRILLADSDPAVRELLDLYLHEAGYDTMVAQTSEEALRLAEAITPDLLCYGLAPDEQWGWDLLGRLRAREPWRSTPTLVVTATETWLDERRRAELGVGLILVQPVGRDLLLSSVRKLLG